MKVFFVGAMMLALAACGSKSDDSTGAAPSKSDLGTKPTEAAGTINKDQATAIASKANTQVVKAANPFSASTNFQATAMSNPMTSTGLLLADDFSTCMTPTESGTKTDADHDGIPVDETMTFSCNVNQALSEGATGSLTFVASGSMEMKDANDALALPKAGFDITMNKIALTMSLNATAEGKTYAYSFDSYNDGSMSVAVTSTALTNDMNVVSSFKFSGDMPGATAEANTNIPTDFAMKEWFHSVVTPTSMTEPEAAGTVDFSGYFTFTTDSDITMSIKSTGLTYGGCVTTTTTKPEFFKSGSITMTDGAGKALVFTFANCVMTTTFDGTAI